MTMHTLQVCLPNTIHDFFDYYAKAPLPKPGARVVVPFGKKTKVGLVIGHAPANIAVEKLKPIDAVLDESPLINEELFALFRFVSQYYQASLGQVLTLGLPKRFKDGKGLARGKEKELTPPTAAPIIALNPEQQQAYEAVIAAQNAHHTFLLYGITGSGKTEVYLEIIKDIIAQGKQALVLVPEIGLTPQLLHRFSQRLSTSIAIIHSNLSEGARHRAWLQAQSGEARVVIGTRSAVFTPFKNLGIIIVDEEHDGSYKQMEGVRFSARDSAIFRAHFNQIPIVLGSATPSLETLANCQKKKYTSLWLHQRAKNATTAKIELVDLRAQPLTEGLAPLTLKAIEQHLAKQHQVLVFINRRGYAPVLLCHQCGLIMDCPACDAHLNLHQKKGKLCCHHCGQEKPLPKICPHCHNHEFIPIGAGTQRIETFLQQHFNPYQIVRIDKDETQTRDAFEKKLALIHDHQAQLIVGTQMLAKGHDFKNLTLVVILDADQGLQAQDFRATERLGQLLTQVAGRAGRDAFKGQVLIQTHHPHHPLLQTLIHEGYDAYAEKILQERAQCNLPPFAHMALIRAEARECSVVQRFLMALKHHLNHIGLQLLGPAPAPMHKRAGMMREQLLISAPTRKILQESLIRMRHDSSIMQLAKRIRWSIDVDPIDLG